MWIANDVDGQKKLGDALHVMRMDALGFLTNPLRGFVGDFLSDTDCKIETGKLTKKDGKDEVAVKFILFVFSMPLSVPGL